MRIFLFPEDNIVIASLLAYGLIVGPFLHKELGKKTENVIQALLPRGCYGETIKIF